MNPITTLGWGTITVAGWREATIITGFFTGVDLAVPAECRKTWAHTTVVGTDLAANLAVWAIFGFIIAVIAYLTIRTVQYAITTKGHIAGHPSTICTADLAIRITIWAVLNDAIAVIALFFSIDDAIAATRNIPIDQVTVGVAYETACLTVWARFGNPVAVIA